MTTLIIIGLPCAALGLYIYSLTSFDKKPSKQNIIEKFASEKVLPALVAVTVASIGIGYIGFMLSGGFLPRSVSSPPALLFPK